MLRGYVSPSARLGACSGRTVTRNEAPSVATAVALQPMMTTTDLSKAPHPVANGSDLRQATPDRRQLLGQLSALPFADPLRTSNSVKHPGASPFELRKPTKIPCVDGRPRLALISPGMLWLSFHRLRRRPAWLQVCRRATAPSSLTGSRF